MPHCGRRSCVDPVLITGSKHLLLGQHDGVPPLGLQLPGLSEEGCQSSDELLLVHVFYSNSRHPAASVLPTRGKDPPTCFTPSF